MTKNNTRSPDAWRHPLPCGGGVLVGKAYDGRPEYRCTKCDATWTRGFKGEPWDDGVQHRDPQIYPVFD